MNISLEKYLEDPCGASSLPYWKALVTAEIEAYLQHNVYSPELWAAVRARDSGKIVASGIAEFDSQIGEGILEWIQVSPEFRRFGLGTFVVSELLHRIAKKANFVTVSGRANDSLSPEKLYRKCGFVGSDIWHILRKK